MRAALAARCTIGEVCERAPRGVGHVRRADRGRPLAVRRLWVLAVLVPLLLAACGSSDETIDQAAGRVHGGRRRRDAHRRRQLRAVFPLPPADEPVRQHRRERRAAGADRQPDRLELPAGRGDADRVGAGVRRGHAGGSRRRSTQIARRCAARSSRASRPTRRGPWCATTPASSPPARPADPISASGARAAAVRAETRADCARRAIRASSARENCGGLTPNGAVSGVRARNVGRAKARGRRTRLTPVPGCAGTIGPPMTDRHAPRTTAERLEHLERLTARSDRRRRRPSPASATAARAPRASGSRRCSTRARSPSSTASSQHRNPNFGMLRKPPLRRRRDHRPRHSSTAARVFAFSQDFTVFGGIPRRGVRREDLQGDGPGAAVRLPARSASTTPAARASRKASCRSAATPTSSCATSTPRA